MDAEDEEEAYERRKQERRLREKEAVYQEVGFSLNVHVLGSNAQIPLECANLQLLKKWESRERKRAREYEKEEEREDERRAEEVSFALLLKLRAGHFTVIYVDYG